MGGGHSGNAVSLNGSGAYVALPDDLLVDVSDFTLASWVFWNGAQTWARLFDFGTGFHRYMMFTPRAVAQRLGRHALRHDGQRPR